MTKTNTKRKILAFTGAVLMLGLVFVFRPNVSQAKSVLGITNVAVATSTDLCGTGFESKNGICLPISNFKEGLASKSTIGELILTVLQYLLLLAGMIAVVALVIGGFWYITSGGNEEQAEKGRKAILDAIIGLVVIMLSYAIVNIITSTLTAGDLLKK